jgi:hypothetical protein
MKQVQLKSGNQIETGYAIYLDNNRIEVAMEDGYKYLTKIETSNSTYTDGKRCWKLKEI